MAIGEGVTAPGLTAGQKTLFAEMNKLDGVFNKFVGQRKLFVVNSEDHATIEEARLHDRSLHDNNKLQAWEELRWRRWAAVHGPRKVMAHAMDDAGRALIKYSGPTVDGRLTQWLQALAQPLLVPAAEIWEAPEAQKLHHDGDTEALGALLKDLVADEVAGEVPGY